MEEAENNLFQHDMGIPGRNTVAMEPQTGGKPTPQNTLAIPFSTTSDLALAFLAFVSSLFLLSPASYLVLFLSLPPCWPS